MPRHDGDLLVFMFAFPQDSKASAMPLFDIDGYRESAKTFTKERGTRGKPVRGPYQRANGNRYQPWAGRMTVNPNFRWYFAQSVSQVEDIPSRTHHDFLSTALHELGHILGFYRDSSPFAFTDLVTQDRFMGAHASSLDRRGIPLDKDSGHIGDYNSATWNGRLVLARPHLQQYLMHGAAHPVSGLRLYPTELDLAMLEDIGYTVDWTRLPRSPYISEYPPPQIHKPRSQVGLWKFKKASDLNRAEIGYPLLYRPANSGLIEGIFKGDHIHIPYRAFLYADHGMAANGGGKNVNQYTVAFDIRLPKLGVEYALLNTTPSGNGLGDVWISPAGRVGQGSYSKESLKANVWYRVVFSADLTKGERKYYVDGRLVHTQTGEKLDGRFSINARGSELFFTLFADSKGDASPIDVRQVALWNYPMPDGEVSALGGPDMARVGGPLE